tara:strand:+ start:5131 stop:5565 length:435 start_codon:yes stop_codon:yes gene_type:complete
MKFYKNALIVATIALMVILAIIATVLIVNKDKVFYPPVVSECPDYWVDAGFLKSPGGEKYLVDPDVKSAAESASNNTDCINFKKLGSCMNEGLIIDPNSSDMFPGGQGIHQGSKMCSQFEWANRCGITWDGITNRENVCSYPKK